MDYQVFQAEKDLVNIYTIDINRILFLIVFFSDGAPGLPGRGGMFSGVRLILDRFIFSSYRRKR
jgi:hypothetical protein